MMNSVNFDRVAIRKSANVRFFILKYCSVLIERMGARIGNYMGIEKVINFAVRVR